VLRPGADVGEHIDQQPPLGGVAVGRTIPGAQVLLDETPLTAASDGGWFVIGFDRDAPSRILLRVTD
jgi:hypothetical protein